MPRLSKVGAAALGAFGWTSGSAVTASYLVVAGGGGGSTSVGGSYNGGAGGAGGFRTGTLSLNPSLSYTVTIGSGGSISTNGSDSVFSSITSTGGGKGGAGASNPTGIGSSGGSGGGGAAGGAYGGAGGSGNTPSTSPSQGNNGGTGSGTTGNGTGGGGGAGAVGANASGTVGGNGGAGTASSISGSSVTYAGGGGGGVNTGGTVGTGGAGGGGNGATTGVAGSGTANTGGGGGSANATGTAGAGGSGIVIISYVGAQQFGGGVVTSSGGNTIHTFTTSGTLVPVTPLTAQYLVVGGGGGGGTGLGVGGGGGAGGYRTGTGLVIDANSIYLVTVGAGGASAVSGSSSAFLTTTSAGGGAGGVSGNGSAGGSGGGGSAVNNSVVYTGGAGNTPSTSPSQGNNGGTGQGINGVSEASGGGGGASAVGANHSGGSVSGAGGAGTANSISGTSVTYAGGGGGGGATAGAGGAGGGGGGGTTANRTGTAGTPNTGGGGGGANNNSPVIAASGGSGIVIISYAGATQQMAGGTVTISGGNVIHTFTSSGYLAPLKYVGNSLRFRSSASAYLNRTFTTPTSSQKFTWGGWIKRGKLDSSGLQGIFAPYSSGTVYGYIAWYQDGIRIFDRLSGGTNYLLQTTAVYRDPAAWYHIVVAVDTTQATASNRVRLYVNGVEVTSFSTSTYPTQNNSTTTNSAIAHNIGYDPSNTGYLDGYQTEINFIDGQALTPSSFGTFNSYGVWQPITYGGSYGTNGFYLPFTNTTSTTTLGYDFSPQGNNWTTNNISLTAGVTYDSMTDVPTLTSATAANFATLNPLLQRWSQPNSVFSNGNLKVTTSSANSAYSQGTIYQSSGKYYWEVTVVAAGNTAIGIGVGDSLVQYTTLTNTAQYLSSGSKTVGGSSSAYGASYTTNDVIGVALDLTGGTVTFYKNNTSQGSISLPSTTNITAFQDINTPADLAINFGQRPFTYTPPTGFVALNTFNL